MQWSFIKISCFNITNVGVMATAQAMREQEKTVTVSHVDHLIILFCVCIVLFNHIYLIT